MNWSEARAAFADAESTIDKADVIATDMARTLRGRLRKVQSRDALAELKRELRDFDLRTNSWKKRA